MRLEFWVCEGLLCVEYELTDTRQGDSVWIDQEHLHVLPNYTYFQLSFWFTTIQENIVIKRLKKKSKQNF